MRKPRSVSQSVVDRSGIPVAGPSVSRTERAYVLDGALRNRVHRLSNLGAGRGVMAEIEVDLHVCQVLPAAVVGGEHVDELSEAF